MTVNSVQKKNNAPWAMANCINPPSSMKSALGLTRVEFSFITIKPGGPNKSIVRKQTAKACHGKAQPPFIYKFYSLPLKVEVQLRLG